MSEALAPGAMIGAYRVERELGSGGMGTVYEAMEPIIGKRVAIKVMRSSFAENAQHASRFEREARAANEVRHPAIVDVFAMGKLDDGRPYLVMSLLEGRSLRDEISQRGKLPPGEAWSIARAAADAISSAHAVSVIHRDFKPDNVFLERHGVGPMRVRLLDFGIAKLQSREDLERLTNTGVPLGTPSYMAPELWWGTEVDARVDQYALGITLYEAIAGRLPFKAEGFMQLVQKHLNETPPPLECSKEIDAFVSKLLAKKPEDRFASMAEAIAAGDRAFELEARMAATMPAIDSPIAFDATVPATPKVAQAITVAGATSPGRYIVAHVVTITLTLGLVLAVGYAGAERWRFKDWYLMSGYPAHLATLAFVTGLVLLPIFAMRRRAPSTAAWWLALLPGLFGLAGTWIGWNQVHVTLAAKSLPQRFGTMNAGFFEIGTLRMIGWMLSWALLLSASTTNTLSSGGSVSAIGRKSSLGALAGAIVLAVVALFAGAPSGALISLAWATTLAIGLAFPARDDARDELERSLATLAVMGIAVMLAFTRVDAREFSLWQGGATRAERVTEIFAALGERRATTGIALVCMFAVIALETARIRSAWPRAKLGRPRVPTIALISLVLVALGADFVLHGRFEGARASLLKELEGPFGLFARLDPPTASLDRKQFAAHRAPTLQITTDVIALDGKGVAKVSALDASETAISLAGALGSAITQSATDPQPDDRDLALAVDRGVKWKTVSTLLALAHRSGARRIELRFTRGPQPTLKAAGPPEASWVLPSDFVAVEIAVNPGGLAPSPDASFLEVAPQIVALAERGPVALSVR